MSAYFFPERPIPTTVVTSRDHMGRELTATADYAEPIVASTPLEERVLREVAAGNAGLVERGGIYQWNEISNPRFANNVQSWSPGFGVRRNLVPNPVAENNITDGGWQGLNATLSRLVTTGALFGSSCFRLEAAAAGDISLRHSAARIGVTAGSTYTASAYFLNNTSQRDVRVYIDWYNSAGTRISANPGTVVPQINDQWVRAFYTGAAPTGAVTAQVIAEVVAAGAAGEVHYIDGVMFNAGALLDYFDGDTPGYAWNGTAHNSVSDQNQTATNLITNPRFNTNTTGWSGALGDYRTNAGASLSRNTASSLGSVYGSASLQVVTTGAAAYQGANTGNTLAVTAGVKYSVYARVKFDSGQAWRIVVGDGTTGPGSYYSTGTGDWQEVHFHWTPTASGTTGIAVSTSGAAAATTFYVDGVTVADKPNMGYFDGYESGTWTGTADASTSTHPVNGLVNALPNPNFRDGVATWGFYQDPAATGAVLDRIVGAGPAGTAAFGRIQPGTGTSNIGIVLSGSNRVNVVPGKTYTLSGYGSVAGSGPTTFRAHIHWYDRNGSLMSSFGQTGSPVSAAGNSWTRATVTATAPAGAKTAAPYFWFDSPYNGAPLYFGALMMHEGNTAIRYFDGDTVGARWSGGRGLSPSVIPTISRSTTWQSGGAMRVVRSSSQYDASPNIYMPHIKGGKTYYCRGIIYVPFAFDGVVIRPYINWYNAAGAYISSSALDTTTRGSASGTFYLDGSVAVAPSNAEVAYLQIIMSGAGIYDYEIENVMVAEWDPTHPVPPYFDGGQSGAYPKQIFGWEGAVWNSRSYRLI